MGFAGETLKRMREFNQLDLPTLLFPVFVTWCIGQVTGAKNRNESSITLRFDLLSSFG